jgi:hypothetical protein
VIRTPLIVNAGRFGRTTRSFDPQAQLAFMERLRPMDPDIFAGEALRQVVANREIIVIPRRWKLVWWLNRISPRLGTALATRSFERMRGALYPPETSEP